MDRISNFDDIINELNDTLFFVKGVLEMEKISELNEPLERMIQIAKELQSASVQDLMQL